MNLNYMELCFKFKKSDQLVKWYKIHYNNLYVISDTKVLNQ